MDKPPVLSDIVAVECVDAITFFSVGLPVFVFDSHPSTLHLTQSNLFIFFPGNAMHSFHHTPVWTKYVGTCSKPTIGVMTVRWAAASRGANEQRLLKRSGAIIIDAPVGFPVVACQNTCREHTASVTTTVKPLPIRHGVGKLWKYGGRKEPVRQWRKNTHTYI